MITNNIASITDGGGGGIALWNSNPIVGKNTISNNLARFGGAIQCYESSPIIEDNLLLDNSAESGGGIVCWNYSSPILNGVTFRNNTATNWADGAIHSINGNLQIDNCIFEENSDVVFGGAINFYCSDTLNITYQLIMTNTLFYNNSGEQGGGTWAGCGDSAKVDVLIEKCSFINNFAEKSGGLWITGGSNKVDFTLSNSIFSANEALDFSAGCSFNRCRGTVSNCLFNSNAASTGGGNWNSGGSSVWSNSIVDFMNCTFADNTASYGAGLTVGYGGNAIITNCIFWNNSVDQIALDTYDNVGGTLTVNYCDIEGGEAAVNIIDSSLCTLDWGEGNIDNEPDYENPGSGEYHLQNTSPCIGTGIDSMMINGNMCYCPTTDIEGNPRPDPEGSMPDMGAYESELANPVGVEEDKTVQPTEYAFYQNYPNPFNPTTLIKFQIPELSFVTLKLYDILGREVATLVNEEKTVGSYEVEFNTSTLSGYIFAKGGYATSVYFYQIQAVPTGRQVGSFIETKKMVLIK